MQSAAKLKQPLLGVIATIITVGFSLMICAQFDRPTLVSWVGLVVMASIPAQIIIIAVWKSGYPSLLLELPQPAKGIAILALMAVVSVFVTPFILGVAGDFVTPPTPFSTMFAVVSVCVSFWVAPLLQCWPVTAITKHPLGIGLGVMVLTYGSAWLVWHFGFDFAAMKGAPFYLALLDPHGAVAAWNIFTFIVTASLVIIGLVMLDFWPIAAAARIVPILGTQPFQAVFSVGLVLAITAAIWTVGVSVLHMDVVDYMVRVPVSGLFGQLIMLHMMQTSPLQTAAQPGKGLGLLALVVVLAPAMYWLYVQAAVHLIGPMVGGPPGYDLDIWIATAMLGVTFPMFVTYGDALGFWPLQGAQASTDN